MFDHNCCMCDTPVPNFGDPVPDDGLVFCSIQCEDAYYNHDFDNDGQPDEMQEWHDFDPDC